MASLNDKVVEYLQDAHAMEQQVMRMLDSMISTTRDPEIRSMLEHHHEETVEHEERLSNRLNQLEKGTAQMKQTAAMMAARGKGLLDAMRGDKPGRNARDGYVTEHLEIAAYELLERIAMKAGDTDTADIAKKNCLDEREMARKLEANWDKFVEQTLSEEGITA
jgi:ferritin-like metal-binding protein YciE